jgi:hypothetical protein
MTKEQRAETYAAEKYPSNEFHLKSAVTTLRIRATSDYLAGFTQAVELCLEIVDGMLETCTLPEDRNTADELRIVRRKQKALASEKGER